MRRILIVALAALALAAPASAANQPDPFFDRVATEIAGHQVYTWCENDPAGWAALAAGHNFRFLPSGFVLFAQPTIGYLSPDVCLPLRSLLPLQVQSARTSQELWRVTWAIFVLLHESTHMKGGVYFNCTTADLSCEGRTDCYALRLLPSYLPRFGFPAELTVSVPYSVPSTVAVKHKKAIRRHGKIVRWKHWTTYKTVYQVAYRDEVQHSPMYDTMLRDAQDQHNAAAASYPEYKGDC